MATEISFWQRQAVMMLSGSFNYQCSHQNVCHPRCFRRQMRACSRLLAAVRKVYDDDPQAESAEYVAFAKKSRCYGAKDDAKKDKSSKMASRPASPARRRDSVARKDRFVHRRRSISFLFFSFFQL